MIFARRNAMTSARTDLVNQGTQGVWLLAKSVSLVLTGGGIALYCAIGLLSGHGLAPHPGGSLGVYAVPIARFTVFAANAAAALNFRRPWIALACMLVSLAGVLLMWTP